MDHKKFVQAVREMRAAQNKYYSTPPHLKENKQRLLAESKKIEGVVDYYLNQPETQPIQMIRTGEVKVITPIVEKILQAYPATRDSDMKLISMMYHDDLLFHNMEGISAKEFLRLMYQEQLEHPESIMRSRRKIQEENSDLRGEHYKERQAKTESIQKDLGYGKT